MRGVYLIDRSLFDHPIFKNEPFTEREAWVWMVGEAAWRERRVRTNAGMVQIERGQLTASIRFLAEKWQWGAKRVRCFLDRLEEDHMISTKKGTAKGTARGTAQAVITVCNYDTYQRYDEYRAQQGAQQRANTGHSKGTARAQQGHKQEQNKHQITPESNPPLSPPSGETPAPEKPLKPDKATRLPYDWQPSDDDWQKAITEGLTHDETRREFEKFRDYWAGVGGAKGRKRDWSATWRNWVRRTADSKPAGSKPDPRGGLSVYAEIAAQG